MNLTTDSTDSTDKAGNIGAKEHLCPTEIGRAVLRRGPNIGPVPLLIGQYTADARKRIRERWGRIFLTAKDANHAKK